MGDITSNLKCRFALDEASGTTCYDAGSEGINATINGAARVAGRIGSGAVTFSNLAHNVDRPSPVAGTTNQLTVSAWVNATAAGSWPIIVCNCPSAVDKGWALHLSAATGKPLFVVTNAPSSLISVTSSSASLVGAGWKHVTCVYNGTDLRIYTDGVLTCTPVACTGNIYFGADTIALRLGNAPASTAFPFTGSIDEVRVYNRALSAADVADLYAFTASPMTVNDIAAGRIFQRNKPTSANPRSKTITLTGTYTTLPTTIEAQLYLEDTTIVALNWTPLTNTTIGGGVWSGQLVVPQGGMYNLQARGKDASGTVLETSIRYGHPFGVGILVPLLGQSNWSNMFVNTSGTLTPHTATRKHTASGWATNTGDGAINLANKLQAGTGLPIGLLAYAVGGSTIANWTDTTGTSVYSAFLAGLAAAGGDCEFISFQQGEQDAVNGTSKATYKAGLNTLYANLREATGRTANELAFACVVLGNIDHVLSTDASTQAIRQGQQEWIGATDGVIYGGSAVDMVQTDGFHWTAPYNARMGLRNAQAILAKLGATTYDARGPRIHHANLSGSQVIVTLVHDSGGTGLKELDGSTDGGSVTGFALTDASGNLPISSTSFGGNTVVLTLGRAAVGSVSLTYQYGETPNITNPVFDNTSPQGDTVGLPLQPTTNPIAVKIGVATESILAIRTTSGQSLYAITSTGVVVPATEDGGAKAGWYSVVDANWINAGLAAGNYSVAFARGDYANPLLSDAQIGSSTQFGWSGSAELPAQTRITTVATGAITSAAFASGALNAAGTLATGTVGGVTTQQQFSIGSVLGSTVVSGQIVVFRNVGGDVSINRVVEFDSGSGELQIDQNASYTVQVGDSVTIYPFDHSYAVITDLLGRTNGSATVGTQLARVDQAITAAVAEIGSGVGASPDTRDLQPVQFTWKLSRRLESTLVSTNTLHIAAGESIRCGFDCDNTIVLPGAAVLGSMTDPTDTGDDITVRKLGIDPKVAKVEVSADENAAAGATEYYVRTTVLNDDGAGPITLIGKIKIVADPTQ